MINLAISMVKFILNKKLNLKRKKKICVEMSKVCNVCTESFNKSNRAIVKCICEFECCRECAKIYLLSRNEDPVCMFCKVQWDRKFMYENFEKSFMSNQYKEYRENVLMERELGMLQATQPYVEREIKMENLSDEIIKVREKLVSLEEELSMLKKNNVVERKKFVRKCPNGNCHGFLSTALKCEICGCWACSECREIKGFNKEEKENHRCDKNILESIKFMEKDTKPCPKCSALIFKINGCNQMYCIECHTAFDWNTLRVEKGVIHNPHYFEYQRKINNGVMPRNPLDMNVVNQLMVKFEEPLPKGWKKRTSVRRYGYLNEIRTVVVYVSPRGQEFDSHPSKIVDIVEICRRVIHIRHVDQLRFRETDRLNNNLQMRINFMRNKINKDDFKKILQKKEKENAKRGELRNILGMYVSVMTDLMYRALALSLIHI